MAASQVVGIVLAAGRSERMGEEKALLEVGGRTFLQATVAALRGGGCEPVVAVVASPDVAFAARAANATIAQGHPEAEQVDSLRSGLAEIDEDVAAVVVLPVDHPRVQAATVRALVDAWKADPDAVVRPVHDDRPGHPTLFPRASWDALRDRSLPRGARSVLESERVVDVAVDDPGVLQDIDTPDAYHRHVDGGA